MNAGIHAKTFQRDWIGSPGRQKGGETVEFALHAALVFLLFFGIIEFAIAMYDQGTMVHASRVGAREASLYWLDVTQITPESDPGNDQRAKPSEIEAAVKTFSDRFLVSFTGADAVVDIFHGGVRINNLATTVVGAQDTVRADVSLLYRAPVTAALAHLLDLNLSARAEMRVE